MSSEYVARVQFVTIVVVSSVLCAVHVKDMVMRCGLQLHVHTQKLPQEQGVPSFAPLRVHRGALALLLANNSSPCTSCAGETPSCARSHIDTYKRNLA